MEQCFKGMGELLPLVTLVLLAFALSSAMGDLGTAKFVTAIVSESVPVFLIPALLFVIAGLGSLTTGTCWGTFGILIPIAIPLAIGLGISPGLVLGAVLGGSVFGDHASPISDTTVIASLAAGGVLLVHGKTQLPYALTAGGLSVALYTTSLKRSVLRLRDSQGSCATPSSGGAEAQPVSSAPVSNMQIVRLISHALSVSGDSHRARGAHLFQLLFAHELTDKVDSSFKSCALDLLEFGQTKRLLKIIDTAGQVTNHESIFGQVIIGLGVLFVHARCARNQSHLFWGGRHIIHQVEKHFVRFLGLPQFQKAFAVLNDQWDVARE